MCANIMGMDDNWLKQTDEPLFPDLLWSKPERKDQAGKLLIIGGHAHGFNRAAAAYVGAEEAGIGEVKVVLPDKLKSVVGASLSGAVYAPSTASGTLAAEALDALNRYAERADAVLLVQPGDNSQTALTLARFIKASQRPVILVDDVVEQIKHDFIELLKPGHSLLVLSLNGLQSVMKLVGAERTVQHDMGLRPLILSLTQEPKLAGFKIITVVEDSIVAVAGGRAVSTTRTSRPELSALAAFAAAWWIWQPAQPLEALATAVFEF